MMAGADAALITLDERSLGVMSPSKLHANLAAGLPVLYVGPDRQQRRRGHRPLRLRHEPAGGRRGRPRSGRAGGLRAGHGSRPAPVPRRAFEEAYSDTATLPRFDAVLDGTSG